MSKGQYRRRHHCPRPCGHETASCGARARPARLVHCRRIRAQSRVGPPARHRPAAPAGGYRRALFRRDRPLQGAASRAYEARLDGLLPGLPWQVRNQARMHLEEPAAASQHVGCDDLLAGDGDGRRRAAGGRRLPHRDRAARHRRPAGPAAATRRRSAVRGATNTRRASRPNAGASCGRRCGFSTECGRLPSGPGGRKAAMSIVQRNRRVASAMELTNARIHACSNRDHR